MLVGEIGKPHGLEGEVYVVRISDDPRRFTAGSRLQHEDGRTVVVKSVRKHRTRFLVKFEGVEGRDAASRLRGPLYIGLDDARNLEDGEYWPHDLIGCEVVVGRGGAAAGLVVDIVPGPAQDLLVVATDRGERFVPFAKNLVTEVDLAARKLTLDPPAGLID